MDQGCVRGLGGGARGSRRKRWEPRRYRAVGRCQLPGGARELVNSTQCRTRASAQFRLFTLPLNGSERCCPRMPRCQRKGSQPQAPAEPEHQGEGREDQADLRELKHVLGVQGKKERACRDACRPQQRVLEGVDPRCAYVVCVQGACLWREDWAHALSRGAVHRNTSR